MLKQIECTGFRKFTYNELRSSGAGQLEMDFLHSWSVALTEASVKIVPMRVKTLSNTNLEASRNIKESLPVDVRRSKTFFLTSLLLSIEFIYLRH